MDLCPFKIKYMSTTWPLWWCLKEKVERNSSTTYLELGHTSQSRGSGLYLTVLTSDISYNFVDSQINFTTEKLATDLGVLTTLSGPLIYWNDSENSGKNHTYIYSFIIAKDHSHNQPK